MIAGQRIEMKPWKWRLLLFELVLFAIILILPQVELPDFAFHGGTAPVAAKLRVCQPLARAKATSPMRLPVPLLRREVVAEENETFTFGSVHERLSVLCALLC
jgi:hypothetical protein